MHLGRIIYTLYNVYAYYNFIFIFTRHIRKTKIKNILSLLNFFQFCGDSFIVRHTLFTKTLQTWI